MSPREGYRRIPKTAEVLAKDPWHLLKAQSYLTKLAATSEDNCPLEKLTLPIIQYCTKQKPTTSAAFETTSQTVPRSVTIHRVMPSEMRRRLGVMKRPAMCGLVEEPSAEDAGPVEEPSVEDAGLAAEAVNASTEGATKRLASAMMCGLVGVVVLSRVVGGRVMC